MASDRYEIRLDSEHRRKLKELAAVRDAPAADVVREIIDEAYEGVLRERRMAAVRRLAAMEIGPVPEPDELSRLLERTHEPGGLS
jgi:predicted transcriptional regulator